MASMRDAYFIEQSFDLSKLFFEDNHRSKALQDSGLGMEKLLFAMKSQRAQRSDAFVTDQVCKIAKLCK